MFCLLFIDLTSNKWLWLNVLWLVTPLLSPNKWLMDPPWSVYFLFIWEIWTTIILKICECSVGFNTGYMWSDFFLPSWLKNTFCYNRNYAKNYTYSWLMNSASTAIKDFCYTHLYVEEQPLLHTCREQFSQLSFVFEPGLHLSTVTTRPSSPPCKDIATAVISDCFKEGRDVNSFGNWPQGLWSHVDFFWRGWRNAFRHCRRAVHNWLL